MSRKAAEDIAAGINPDHIYRYDEHFRLFGLRETAIRAGIANGTIPKPVDLTTGKRKRKGWLGRQVIEHQQKLLEQARTN